MSKIFFIFPIFALILTLNNNEVKAQKLEDGGIILNDVTSERYVWLYDGGFTREDKSITLKQNGNLWLYGNRFAVPSVITSTLKNENECIIEVLEKPSLTGADFQKWAADATSKDQGIMKGHVRPSIANLTQAANVSYRKTTYFLNNVIIDEATTQQVTDQDYSGNAVISYNAKLRGISNLTCVEERSIYQYDADKREFNSTPKDNIDKYCIKDLSFNLKDQQYTRFLKFLNFTFPKICHGAVRTPEDKF